jgi:NAD(P)-dependent dehydrogenase (short-subunit alcohol dehydrogenase family)
MATLFLGGLSFGPALNNLTLSLFKALAGTGVTSKGIMPGLIYTPQLDKFFIETAQRQGSDDPEFGRQYVLKNIVHRPSVGSGSLWILQPRFAS